MPSLARFGLLLVRPGMLVVSTPVFGGVFVPAPVRIGLIVLLAVTIGPHVPVVSGDAAGLSILGAVGAESIVGLALGMGVRCLIAAAELGGHLAGFQLGLSYAAVVDPQSGVRNNVLASLYGNLALVTFLGTNGHHALIGALARSYDVVPLGAARLAPAIGDVVPALLGIVFMTGVQIAMPIVTALLLVELALGLVARAAPSLNLMVVGTPLRLLVGLLALAGSVQVIPPVVAAASHPALDTAWRLVRALH
jgi:flagellar biosynthetic protein FliR